jgi:hypothetical protein
MWSFSFTNGPDSNSVSSSLSLMSEYSIRPGGSLKLKGGVAEGGIVKKWVIHSWSIQLYINNMLGRRRSPSQRLKFQLRIWTMTLSKHFCFKKMKIIYHQGLVAIPPLCRAVPLVRLRLRNDLRRHSNAEYVFTISYSLKLIIFSVCSSHNVLQNLPIRLIKTVLTNLTRISSLWVSTTTFRR